jgi:hypothetical protein
MRIHRSVAAGAALVLCTIGVAVAAAPGPAAAAGCQHTNLSDFNGDGVADVAIGEVGAARFHVIYGHGHALNATTPPDQLFNGPADVSGFFAVTMVTGDFNDDGCADLAVGDWANEQGDVTIYLGSTGGLKKATVLRGQVPALTDEQFGYSLAVGDVTGDGHDDLIVGAPGENAVYVFEGNFNGVSSTGHRYLDGHGGVPGSDGLSDGFGTALAVGDFDGDFHADVAIGAPGAGTGGRVYVLRGGSASTPLLTTGAQTWSQASPGVPGTPESGDRFGAALAAGNFEGSGLWGLAIGVPGESLDGIDHAGLVDVLDSGGAGGLTGTGAQEWDQAVSGVPGTATANEAFGEVLASADFNGDSHDDLAVGQPRGSVGAATGAGDVTVLYGASGGLSVTGAQRFTQNSAGVAGTAESNDRFGTALAAVRLTHSADYDLVVGVAFEALGSTPMDGMIQLLPGTPAGLTGSGSESWDDGSAGVKGAGCSGCWFGMSVAGTTSTSAL